MPEGEITEHGLRVNIDIGIQYLEFWVRGTGCVPIYNLMKDRLGMQRFQSGKFELACKIFVKMMTSPEFPDFLTLAAYEYLD